MPEQITPPRLVAWEVTKACNLACKHCRAMAQTEPSADELTHQEGLNLIKQIAQFAPKAILILTGGEPMMRPDIYDLANYGVKQGLHVVMSPNGTLIDAQSALKLKKSGLSRVSVSLDAATAEKHDIFRGQPGAFEALKSGLNYLKEVKLPFQINTTITATNINEIEVVQNLAIKWGAVAQHVFLLVPTGRGTELSEGVAKDYEEILKTLLKRAPNVKIEFKATCAPQYNRLIKENQTQHLQPKHLGRGCMGGNGFVFISHNGLAQPCGYLPLNSGSIREQNFADIYTNSNIFLALRDKKQYKGKCAFCKYWNICGGCRARAHAKGNFLGEEPLCPYQPLAKESDFF